MSQQADPSPVAALSGYELRNLVLHLVDAGRFDHLHRLLRLQTPDGRNAWFNAKERARDAGGYVTDVVAALAAVPWPTPADGGGSRPGTGLAAEYRYSLLLVSVNSVAGRVVPPLLGALVRHGLWSVADALSYARRTPDALQRADALFQVLPHLDEPGRVALAREVREVIAAGRMTGVGDWTTGRVKLLAAMAQYLPGLEREAVLSELVDVVLALLENPDEWYYAQLLGPTTPLFSDDQVESLLTAVLRHMRKPPTGNSLASEELLQALAFRATGPLAVAVARAVRRNRKMAWRRAAVLTRVAPNLPGRQRAKALAKAVAAAADWDSAGILTETLPFTGGRKRRQHLRQAIARAREEEDPAGRAFALLELARQVEDDGTRSDLFTAARDAARAMPDSGTSFNPFMADPLAELTDDVPAWLRDELLQSTLAAGRKLRGTDNVVHVLAVVARHLDEPQRSQVLDEAVQALAKGSPPTLPSSALEHLAPVLPAAMLPRVLAITRRIDDGKLLRETLGALAPFRRDGPADAAAAKARAAAFDHSPSRVEVLAAFARRMPAEPRASVLAEALDVALGAGESDDVTAGLATLAPVLADERHGDVLDAWERAVRRAQAGPNPLWRADALTGLLSAAPATVDHGRRERIVADALAAARQTKDGSVRAERLAALLPHVADERRPELVAEALTTVRRGWYQPWFQALALAAIANRLPEDQRTPLLAEAEAALALEPYHPAVEVDALVAIATSAPPAARRKRLERAASIAETTSLRSNALARVAPHLEEPERSRTLEAALAEARSSGSYTLWEGLRHGLGLLSAEDFHRLIPPPPAALQTLNRDGLCYEIRYLAPLLARAGGPGTADELIQALHDVERWWP
jgi:hypothetical protein